MDYCEAGRRLPKCMYLRRMRPLSSSKNTRLARGSGQGRGFAGDAREVQVPK